MVTLGEPPRGVTGYVVEGTGCIANTLRCQIKECVITLIVSLAGWSPAELEILDTTVTHSAQNFGYKIQRASRGKVTNIEPQSWDMGVCGI